MTITPEQLEEIKTQAFTLGYTEGTKFASKFQHERYITILENELKQYGPETMAFTFIMRCILLLEKDRKDTTGESNGKD